MNRRILLNRILSGRSDTNIPFQATCNLLESLGFKKRIKGSHHIFTKTGVVEQINLQPCGGKVVAYQVGQIRQVLINYNLKE